MYIFYTTEETEKKKKKLLSTRANLFRHILYFEKETVIKISHK